MGAHNSNTDSLKQMLALGVSFSSHLVYKTRDILDETDLQNLGIIAVHTKLL